MITKTKIKSKSKTLKKTKSQKTKTLVKTKTPNKPSFFKRNEQTINKLGLYSLVGTAIALQGFNYYKKSIRDKIHRDIQFAIHSGYSKEQAVELVKEDFIKTYGSDKKTMEKFKEYVIYSFKETEKGNDPLKKLQQTMDETLKKLKNSK